MTPTCMDDCRKNFEMTKVLFGPAVCQECQGCIMAQVYKETNGEHPSYARLDVQVVPEEPDYQVLGTWSGEPGEEEPVA